MNVNSNKLTVSRYIQRGRKKTLLKVKVESKQYNVCGRSDHHEGSKQEPRHQLWTILQSILYHLSTSRNIIYTKNLITKWTNEMLLFTLNCALFTTNNLHSIEIYLALTSISSFSTPIQPLELRRNLYTTLSTQWGQLTSWQKENWSEPN